MLHERLGSLEEESRAMSERLWETQQELLRQQLLRLECTTEQEDLIICLKETNAKLEAQLSLWRPEVTAGGVCISAQYTTP
jgi:predicted flavoprotein YhiN